MSEADVDDDKHKHVNKNCGKCDRDVVAMG